MWKTQSLAVLAAVLAVACTGIASVATDVVPRSPSIEVTVDGGVTPKALSKGTYTPVAFSAAGTVRTTDGTQPPPAKEVLIDAKNVAVDTTGYPTCTGGVRQIRRDLEELRKACPDSIVGEGQVTVWVASRKIRRFPPRARCSSSTVAPQAAPPLSTSTPT